VVLSRLAPARLFPGEDPIGKYSMRGPSGAWFTVAGVADDAKNRGLTSDEDPEIYYLRGDVASDWRDRRTVLVIRSALPEATVAGLLQAAVHKLDPTVPVEMEPLTAATLKPRTCPRRKCRAHSRF
jgi:putative ABC transport system permease protein